MELTLTAQELEMALRELPDARKPLVTDPRGQDPANMPSPIAYDRGALFHYNLEQAFGRDAYDRFLARWFERYAFSSVTSENFLLFLNDELIATNPGAFSPAEARQWLYEPEPPDSTIWPESEAFVTVDRQRAAWIAGEISAREIDAEGWTWHHWLRFISLLPDDLTREQMAELDARFDLTRASNKMIAREWFIEAVEREYTAAYPAIEEHLKSVGRMLLITPIYEALARTPDGRVLAERIYDEARSSYHPIARASVERALAEAGEEGERTNDE